MSRETLSKQKYKCRNCGEAYFGSARGWFETMEHNLISLIHTGKSSDTAFGGLTAIHHCDGRRKGEIGVSDLMAICSDETNL